MADQLRETCSYKQYLDSYNPGRLSSLECQVDCVGATKRVAMCGDFIFPEPDKLCSRMPEVEVELMLETAVKKSAPDPFPGPDFDVAADLERRVSQKEFDGYHYAERFTADAMRHAARNLLKLIRAPRTIIGEIVDGLGYDQ